MRKLAIYCLAPICSTLSTARANVQQAIHTFDGPVRGGNFGYAVALVRDLNGDGRADLVIGAPHDDSAGVDAGKVQVCSGADQSVLFELVGNAGDHFGHSVCSLGDVNGDGRGDFAVGAPYADNLFPDCGRVTTFGGGAANAVVLGTINGQSYERFGWSVAYAGKAGTTARVIVGAPHALSGLNPEAGRAALHATNGAFIRERRGAQPHEHYGWSVGGNCDVNGDGVPDVIVGAPDYDLFGLPNQGRVEVLSGSTGSVLYAHNAGSLAPSFGHAVAGLPDANGDGRGDYVVGAPRYSTLDAVERGAARLFSGSNGATLITKHGDSAGDHFGHSVACLGDANADGRTDWAVGAPGDVTFLLSASLYGRAYGYSGATGASLSVMVGGTDQHRQGFAVAGGADVNGDGRDDLIAGAPFRASSDRSTDVGVVKVIVGNATQAIHYIPGPAREVWLGQGACGVGDVNGDMMPDFAVAAPREDTVDAATGTTQRNAGVVRVVSGSSGALLREHAGMADDNLGTGLAAVGDVNGDGIPDYAAGAPRTGAFGVGHVRVFSGLNGTVLHTLLGQANENFGIAVSGGVDLDGDGRADVVVGANRFAGDRGRVLAFSGLTGALLFAVQGAAQDIQFGRAVASIGDINGDGRGELVVGAFLESLGGRAHVLSGSNGATLRSHQPDASNVAWFGFACARLGDVNLDGVGDYVIGGPRESANAQAEPGTVRIYSGATGIPLVLKVGNAANDHLGWSVANLGDLNLDGRPDVIAGTYPAQADFSVDLGAGYALAISGADGSSLMQRNGQTTGDVFGYSVAGVGDLDGDGKPEALIGAPKVRAFRAAVGRASVVSLAY